MKHPKKPLEPASKPAAREYTGPRASWWKRVKFKIWLLFKKPG